jgi:hypothetical protein
MSSIISLKDNDKDESAIRKATSQLATATVPENQTPNIKHFK